MLVTINEIVVFIIKIIVIYIAVYGIVDRVCKSVEYRACVKYGHELNKEENQNGHE